VHLSGGLNIPAQSLISPTNRALQQNKYNWFVVRLKRRQWF
jgi:hypothetical protein